MPLNVDKISTGSLSINGTEVIPSAPQIYKVYTALLTQSGGDVDSFLIDNGLVIGITYRITPYGNTIGVDFTNIGAPNNNAGTYFVATGTIPNSWGNNTDDSPVLQYNTGAPVVTVLENTIGNIWFEFYNEGVYRIDNTDGWDRTKLWYGVSGIGDSGSFNVTPGRVTMSIEGSSFFIICYNNDYTDTINNQLVDTPIEIRVYN